LNGDTFSNINGGHLKLLGKAELAEGDEILLAEHVVLVLGTHHHRSVLVGRSATLGALEANLVEPKVGHLYAVIRIGLHTTYGTSFLTLSSLRLLLALLLLLLPPSDVLRGDNTSVAARRVVVAHKDLVIAVLAEQLVLVVIDSRCI